MKTAARKLMALKITLKPAAVGSWTFPYICPRGTAAVQVTKLDNGLAYLSDGSSMHVSRVRVTTEGTVAP